MTLTKERADALAEKMAAAQPKTARLSLREFVALLTPRITEMRQVKGYSWDDIAAFLKTEGVDISVTTLRSYITKAKPAGARRAVRERKPKAVAPATPASAPRVQQADRSAATHKTAETPRKEEKTEAPKPIRSSGFVIEKDPDVI